MTKEKSSRKPEGFEFTKDEKLYDRITDERFREIVFNEHTTIHNVDLDSNNYGEFLFVKVSRLVNDKPQVMTFWGLGFHEYRERWYDQEWYFHKSYAFSDTLEQVIEPEKAQDMIEQRRKEVEQLATDGSERSAMGALFEIIADLTDDDGAIAEMNDLWFLLDDTENDD